MIPWLLGLDLWGVAKSDGLRIRRGRAEKISFQASRLVSFLGALLDHHRNHQLVLMPHLF